MKKILATLACLLPLFANSYEIVISKKNENLKACLDTSSFSDDYLRNGIMKNFRYVKNIEFGDTGCNYKFSVKNTNDGYSIYHKGTFVTLTKSQISSLGANKVVNKFSDFIYTQIFSESSFFLDSLVYVEKSKTSGVYSLLVSNFDGEDKKLLLKSNQPILSPKISPNKKYVAYVSFEKVRPAIFIQSLENNSRVLVSNFKGINGFPSFSPDSSKLIFSLSKNANSDIYEYVIAKHEINRLTAINGNEVYPVYGDNGDIYFVLEQGFSPNVYKMNSNKKADKLFKTKSYTLSPDYSKNYISALFLENKMYGIVLYNNLNKEEKVVKKDFNIESPSISNNGKLIVYSTKFNNVSVLNFIDSNGNNLFRIRSSNDLIEPSLK